MTQHTPSTATKTGGLYTVKDVAFIVQQAMQASFETIERLTRENEKLQIDNYRLRGGHR